VVKVQFLESGRERKSKLTPWAKSNSLPTYPPLFLLELVITKSDKQRCTVDQKLGSASIKQKPEMSQLN